jgi:hypothetical protein
MISTFNEWLNESESRKSNLSLEELEHIKKYANSEPEYDEEEDEAMPKIVAEYLEEIKATDPLSKNYLKFLNDAIKKSNGDEISAIDLINDMYYDYLYGEDFGEIESKMFDMISHPIRNIEATPGSGVTYDDVSIAIEKLGEYRAEQAEEHVYSMFSRGWVPGGDYHDDFDAAGIVGEYEEIVLAIRNKDGEYLNTLDVEVALALANELPLDVMDKYKGRIAGTKFGI